MNSFVFNSFKEKFLNGNVPSAMNCSFIPMNNKFVDNFTTNEFSIEQFRNVSDLTAFKKSDESDDLYEDSKLKFDGIEYTWTKIIETEERNKPMFINSENYDSLTASEEYWSLFSANKNINTYINRGGFYILRTKEELNWFADTVNDGNNGVIGVLADSISNRISVMIGNDESIPFQGILDGNGFSLTAPVIVCTASDNGLVGILGQNGIVRNFVIETDKNDKDAWLKCEKQINLNYLKHDARDVNAGILVGRNYGTIENVRLGIQNFRFSGFVPQVYSVSNKSDEYTDFQGIRKKFDNGENFFFLNSWCVNSPGNICPYVGYFAEGVFAESGWNKEYNYNGKYGRCTDYNPKMKAYYDTGLDEYTLDFSETDEDENRMAKITPLGLYIKYDWYRDEVLNPGGNSAPDLENYDNHIPIDFLLTKNAGADNQYIVHHIADNSIIRTTELNYIDDEERKTLKSAFNGRNRKALLEDPTWLSYNDDPAGRNAVMFLKCEFNSANKSKTVYLEVNGMLQYDSNGDRLRFVAGKIDTSQFSPISESEPSMYGDSSKAICIDDYQNPILNFPIKLGNDRKVYVRCGILFKGIGDFNNSEMGVCDIVCDEKAEYNDANWDTSDLDYSEPSPISLDTTDSVRAFTIDDESNTLHELNITSINGFNYSITIDSGNFWLTALGSEKYGFAKCPILANAVADTTKDICNFGDGYTIRFKSKCLSSPSIIHENGDDNLFNDTHIKNANGDYSKYDSDSFNEHYKFSETLYTIDDPSNMLYKCAYDNHIFLHANDYKQLIASNYNGYYACKAAHGLQPLMNALANYSINKEYYSKIIKRCFEKVNVIDGVYKELTLDDITRCIDDLKNGVFNNITKLIKYEIDYTSVSRASGIDDDEPILNDNVSLQRWMYPSRHIYIFNNSDDVIDKFKKYFEQRPYNRIYDDNFQFSCETTDGMITSDDEGKATYRIASRFFINDVNAWKYQYATPGGSISVSEFNFEKFIYSPYACTTYSKDNKSISNFDAGRSYNALTDSGEDLENIYSAANFYVKQPTYFGLDFEGNWTTMPVRYSNFNSTNSAVNQINYNWNIIRKMYEDKYDPDDEDKLFWKGLYYDDNISIQYNNDKIEYKYSGYDGKESSPINEWTECSLVPAGILNKSIRMHNMVRAAYNISPLVGANHGTIRNVVGQVDNITNSGNYVCFIGGVAGKNVNGTIENVELLSNYALTKPGLKDYGRCVYYKNTPVLPYSATKTINIPTDPDLNEKLYKTYPTAYSDEPISTAHYDLASAVSCISFYDNDYRDNPQYTIDKINYDQLSNFKYFTSAWYDTSTDNKITSNDVPDDVIRYHLPPIFVIGGIVGRVVASNVSSTSGQIVTKISNVSVGNKANLPSYDMHSMSGTVIGQIDVYTTDVGNKNINGLIELKNISAQVPGNAANDFIGYVDYQPIDVNNVVALYGWSRKSKYGDDYIGYTTDTLYGIDQPIIINHSSEDDNGSFYKVSLPPEFSVVNQSSAAFISPVQAEPSEGYYKSVFNKVIKIENVDIKNQYIFTDLASDIYYDTKNGPISVNAVFGSNTITEYSANHVDHLISKVFRIHKRSQCKTELNVYDGRYYDSYRNMLGNSVMGGIMSKKNIEDMFFSYTYTTTAASDEKTKSLSADMFDDISVKFFGAYDDHTYLADFGDQDGTLGDDIEYGGHNNLVFGRSMSPTYIRHELNKDENKNGFNSYLFSAYQLNDEGEHIQANYNNQLGGFLVVDKNTDDLVMFISNENGAEIDGRSYNLAFPAAAIKEPIKDKEHEYNTIKGGIILRVGADNIT